MTLPPKILRSWDQRRGWSGTSAPTYVYILLGASAGRDRLVVAPIPPAIKISDLPMRNILFGLCLLFAVPAAAQTNERLPVGVGDEVRIRGPLRGDGYTMATIREFGPSYLYFTVENRPGVVFVRSYKNLGGLDVPGFSRTRGAKSGAMWGFYLGGAAGVVAGPFTANAFSMETGTSMGVLGVGAGLVGGLVGAAAGAILFPKEWQRYVLE